jgi:serine/threonine protein kinase
MEFLHSAVPPILHRDLKTPNVFVMSVNEADPVLVKIADFGLSSRLYGAEIKEKAKTRAVEVHLFCHSSSNDFFPPPPPPPFHAVFCNAVIVSRIASTISY